MSYNNLSEYIQRLDKEGELLRIRAYVDPILEIAEITDRISKSKDGGKALLFENTGTNFPVLINSMGSDHRMSMALGVDKQDDIGKEFLHLFKQISTPRNNAFEKIAALPELLKISSWLPKSLKGKGRCQEIINIHPDLNQLPVLKCWPHDGGRFVTLPMVHTKDPNTGIRNVGMYRMQIFNANTTGMHWHRHKTGARHFNGYKQLGQKMPVAVTLGGDPVLTYAATAPLPDNLDEYLFAGFLRKRKVNLVKCITQDIEVPDEVDIVIEGYVDPTEPLAWEGPFGDHTGFYSLPDWYPYFHVTCITHKKHAIYPATIVGIPPQEDAYIAKATERIFLPLIQLSMLPEVEDMDLPVAGVAHNISIIKIKKTFPGHAPKVMNSLWGAGQMMFNKFMAIVDGDINIHDYKELAKYMALNFNPATDVYFGRGPLDVLDHSASALGYGGKLCIDATKKFEEEIPTSPHFQTPITPFVDKANLLGLFNEISEINDSLCAEGIPVVLISYVKSKGPGTKAFANKLIGSTNFTGIKIVVLVDSGTDVFDVFHTLWIMANHTDPARDAFLISSGTAPGESVLVLDGSVKSKEFDVFSRKWPNIIVSDDNTIESIDKKWAALNIGTFIPSPSKDFKHLIINDNFIAHE
jgi:4-hydroxy-3-polyprenylbenzoate decarboxylase